MEAVCMCVCVCEQCCNLMLVETITKAPFNFHLVPFNNPRVQFTVQVCHSLLIVRLSNGFIHQNLLTALLSELSKDQLSLRCPLPLPSWSVA